MSKRTTTGVAMLAAWLAPIASADDAWPERFGFGHEATADEIRAWDIDVLPDGTGLPEGTGSVSTGAEIYAVKCAACHGATGVEGPNDRLVAYPGEGFPSGTDADSWTGRTIGNYWPYATTLFDYIRRSMPQTFPGSLTSDEVYA
ncbi:MAG: c-type cytochrome, partial [Pseudomonadota bacterium]